MSKACWKTGDLMDQRFVLHVKDFAVAEVWRGYALIRAGEKAAGLRHMVNAFWHDPNRAEVKAAISYVVATGRLHARNFLPTEPVIMSFRRRRGPVKWLTEQMPALLDAPNGSLADGLPALDPLTWDWDPLLRKNHTPGAVRKGVAKGYRELLAKMQADDPDIRAAIQGVDALLAAHMGELESARTRLETLAGQLPNHAMTAQRLSHVCWMARDFKASAAEGQRAADLAPEVPAIRAWAGMVQLRNRAWEKALTNLSAAYGNCIGIARIPALLTEALARTGSDHEALASIRAARQLAPMEAQFSLVAANLSAKLGDIEEAIALLEDLVSLDRSPQRGYILLAELLIGEGQAARASEVLEQGLIRSPESPPVDRAARQTS